jgi:hypothetical protein
MTPRKWTEADVTEEDIQRFDTNCYNCVGYSPFSSEWEPSDIAELVAACWNRLEEKRAKEESDPFFDADHLAEVGAYMEERARKKLLAQALEALREIQSVHSGIEELPESLVEIRNVCAEAIAALEKEVGA